MGSWLPTINVGDFVGNHVGDSKNGEKDLAVKKITGIIRYEGSDKTGVGVISISLSAIIIVVKGASENVCFS